MFVNLYVATQFWVANLFRAVAKKILNLLITNKLL